MDPKDEKLNLQKYKIANLASYPLMLLILSSMYSKLLLLDNRVVFVFWWFIIFGGIFVFFNDRLLSIIEQSPNPGILKDFLSFGGRKRIKQNPEKYFKHETYRRYRKNLRQTVLSLTLALSILLLMFFKS